MLGVPRKCYGCWGTVHFRDSEVCHCWRAAGSKLHRRQSYTKHQLDKLDLLGEMLSKESNEESVKESLQLTLFKTRSFPDFSDGGIEKSWPLCFLRGLPPNKKRVYTVSLTNQETSCI